MKSLGFSVIAAVAIILLCALLAVLLERKGAGRTEKRMKTKFWLRSAVILLLGLFLLWFANIIKIAPDNTSFWKILLLKGANWKELAHLFVLEIGFALVVGFVVAVTVERYMERERKREYKEEEERIKRNVFEALFKTAISPELVREMYLALFVPKFVRKELQFEITFSPLSQQEQYDYKTLGDTSNLLIIQQTAKFKAHNTTDKIVEHSIRPREFVLLKPPDFTPFTDFRMTGSDGEDVHLDAEKIRERLNREKTDAKKSENGDAEWEDLGKQTVNVRPNESVDVCVVERKICRYEDTHIMITKHAAEGVVLTVKVTDLKLYEELEFATQQSHRQELRKSLAVKSNMSYEWKLNYPILPCQGIILYWRRRPK